MNDLELALHLADLADSLTLPAFQQHDFAVETKPDLTPVTEIDRGVEQTLRAKLAQLRPADAVIGEEFPNAGSSRRRWIIDPIDGTKNFVRGVPVYATLIGLFDGDTALLGVVSAPALGARWYAARGTGAFKTAAGIAAPPGAQVSAPRRLNVSRVGDLDQASLSYASLGGWQELGKRTEFLDLCDAVWRTRGFGDFWSYMMVAEGVVDIAAEPELELYDMAALVCIVSEAGGTFTSLDGQPGPFGGNALVTNGLLHTKVMEKLS